MRSNDSDDRGFNEFLVRWNAGDGRKAGGKGWRRRKPIPQWQKDKARDEVEARRRRMSY